MHFIAMGYFLLLAKLYADWYRHVKVTANEKLRCFGGTTYNIMMI